MENSARIESTQHQRPATPHSMTLELGKEIYTDSLKPKAYIKATCTALPSIQKQLDGDVRQERRESRANPRQGRRHDSRTAIFSVS
jgi:hypothetical protein